ncbi:intermembrane lipid transfer protein VPS13D-like [Clavelina lepadiformis]|uniref:intermembrane lipid transfer protein VPS13D-like n=1 Tax=Clavelina lepadiformis TaxID=159417 RepID=UPI004041D287
MLERFASQVLNRYIGQYVENFNAENLSIGIVQGAVELEGLHLRKDALREFDLPGVEVTWGYIGKISLRIPSYKSYSEPWIIDINKLYVIVSPSKNRHEEFDGEAERKCQEARKLKQLAELEEKWQATQGTSKSIYSIWHSYSSSIVTNIVENLQVRLFDLHIRFEDDVTLPGVFAFGIHIDVLSAQTTDENWEPTSTSAKGAEKKWKKMHLSEMSLYWDTQSNIFGNLPHDAIVDAMMRHSKEATEAENELNDKHQQNEGENVHEYMLCPVSGEARFTRACSHLPLRSRKTPRLTLDLDLSSIPLQLNKPQYNQMLVLGAEVARWDTRKKNRVGRPAFTVTENPGMWWRWAMNTHIERIKQKRQRLTFSFMLKRAKSLTTYVKSYRQYLYSRYVRKTKTNIVPSILQELESEYTFDELRILRELVYQEIDEETRRRQEAEKLKLSKRSSKQGANGKSEQAKKGWGWGGWLGWRSKQPERSSPDATSSGESSAAATDEEADENTDEEFSSTNDLSTLHESVYKNLNEDEFIEMFGDEFLDEDTTDTFLRRDTVLLKLNFILKSGTLKLTNNYVAQTSQTGLVSLEFNAVNLASEWRPRSGTHEIKIDLGGIVLKDLDQRNKHYCDIVKPCPPSRRRPTSPLNVTPPGTGLRLLGTEKLNNLLAGGQSKVDSSSFEQEETESPVFSVTYKKLPQTTSGQFSDSLKIVTAPLSLTFLPGILDRLKLFFKTPKLTNEMSSGVDSEMLTKAAKERYEVWMKRTQADVKNRVRKMMEGKEVVEVNRKRWAVSLDIFAPEITIPEDWSDPNCKVVVFNLGHMTFENHRKGELPFGRLDDVSNRMQAFSEDYDSDDDDDEFVTPAGTPPNESNLAEKSDYLQEEKVGSTDVDGKLLDDKNDTFDQNMLSERMLREKMYESYHLHFADLQVQVTSNKRRWETPRPIGKSPLDLVERFSVDLLTEKRVVSTTDPRFPAVMLSGNLPHLMLHFSHEKVHTFMKCMEVLKREDLEKPSSSSPANILGVPKKSVMKKSQNAGSSENESLVKALSKQLTCDFLINEISVFLEDADKGVLSVLEVRRIQTRFTQRPFDTTAYLSIYSLLLVDLMQQLGSDYELLLASHRNVSMDVGSGNMLDSGSASPQMSSQTKTHTGSSLTAPVKRCTSEPTITRSHNLKSSATSTVLHTVAENLRQFAHYTDRYLNLSGGIFAEDVSEADIESHSSQLPASMFEYIITLEFKNLREGSPDLKELSVQNNATTSLDEAGPLNVINANFNNLDVVFNANTWVTILNFVHKLKPPTGPKLSPRNSRNFEPNKTLDDYQLKTTFATTQLPSKEDGHDATKTRLSFNFKQLNVLLLRHVYGLDSTIGRKLATVTMQGTKIGAELGKVSEKGENSGDLDIHMNVTGSVASLQMQDLTPGSTGSNTPQALSVLSIGKHELVPGFAMEVNEETDADAIRVDGESDAFSLDFQRGAVSVTPPFDDQTRLASKSESCLPDKPSIDDGVWAGTSLSDSMMFNMEAEDQKDNLNFVKGTESRLNVKLASACYIHSPRMIAELLALSDETGDIIRAQMTTATRQAYKDMARSIMDKVSDYGMAVLGKSMIMEESLLDELDSTPDITSQPTIVKSQKSVTNKARFCFLLQMQTPIVALPKVPGSFELLVANLGQITIQNDHDISSGLDPLDKLKIKVVNMNLRSHRQREEELAAKKSEKGNCKDKISNDQVTSGPSIMELKRDSLRFVNLTSNEEQLSNCQQLPSDVQIVHKTSLELSIIRKPYIPNPKSSLDTRKCCEKSSVQWCSERSSCSLFASHIGAISEMRMCVAVHAASPLTVTLSKSAYEQVLKTMDNISFGGDIDRIEGYESSTSISLNIEGRKPTHSMSAPALVGTPRSQNSSDSKTSRSSTSSHQSTPRPGMEHAIFEIPGLESMVPSHAWSQSTQNLPQRKYTPISAKFTVPCLIFQLSGDLSEGEQGIVKVTLQRFNGAYEKENRFGTSLDLSLGSLDIEDLLQEETSPIRHIVVSASPEEDADKKRKPPSKTDFLSTSCPSFLTSPHLTEESMSISLPTVQKTLSNPSASLSTNRRTVGVFRPYESFNLSAGAFGSISKTRRRKYHRISASSSKEESDIFPLKDPPTPPSSPTNEEAVQKEDADNTLVRICAFLVDGKSDAYRNVYDRVNRRVDIDFNSLDCKVNPQTWVVLLDFFGIGTSPKKTYRLDAETEETFSWDKRMDVRSFYENQPDDFVNSEIAFTVRSFSLTFNKPEYQLMKASVEGLQSNVQIRDGTLRVFGQLGNLSVSDLSPNGSLYRERFIFTGDKALDFDIRKYDEYDHHLLREFDISVKLRMSSIRYVHTQRFQNETVAYCQHFQQLQEVLGRMRAASVGQNVRTTSCRQARVLLSIEADAPIILIPESSHTDRLLVANLGHITVRNEFLTDGKPGTLSYNEGNTGMRDNVERRRYDLANDATQSPSHSPRACLLDVIHVDLIDMDLFTATYTRKTPETPTTGFSENTMLIFPSYTVTCHTRPLLKEKAKLELQMERNLEKEITHQGVPDTALSARLSSVYCSIDHTQYWLIRGVLDHNAGEAIPDFPQPTSFLQPSTLQTVLTGAVYTGLSMDFCLSNVSIELLENHATGNEPRKSLGRLDFVKSLLSYRAHSNNMKTTNLSCEAFRADDTRFEAGFPAENGKIPSVFTTVLGVIEENNRSMSSKSSRLQFEIFQRSGPGLMEFTALLNNMRVYVIIDWLLAMNKYIIQNPDQNRCDSLRSKTAQLMHKHRQVDSGNQRNVDSSGQLEPEVRTTDIKLNFTNTEFVVVQDSSRLDSDAVILHSTAILRFSPDEGQMPKLSSRGPLSCSLQSLEVFSCQLDKEHETALSIIDPVNVNFEVRPVKQTDLLEDEIESNPALLDKNILEIHMTDLNMRVSYNDMMLFLDIFKSLPSQAGLDTTEKPHTSEINVTQSSSAPSRVRAVYQPTPDSVMRLTELGFSKNDVVHALTVNSGSVSEAGSWLMEHCTLEIPVELPDSSSKKQAPLSISRVNVNMDLVGICLIDDCAQDCDVPLTEIAVRNLRVRQAIGDDISRSPQDVFLGQTGSATFSLSGDYYNRMLSLWEPFLEPWRCNISWNHELARSSNTSGKWSVRLEASDRFDVSVTSTLIETVRKTFATWHQDYTDSSDPKMLRITRKRQPLVPYLLRNLTGTPLYFITQTAALRDINVLTNGGTSSNSKEWKEVLPGEECPFNFATIHEKQRHKRSETLTLHQINVRVDEWKTLQPVTVSKVGTYFRHAFKEIVKSSAVYEPLTPIRVVFHVTLEGNAQKVVTVRSALAVRSRVKIPVQLQLTAQSKAITTLPILEPDEIQYIPISLIQSSLKIRPHHNMSGSFEYSSSSITWQNVPVDKQEESCLVECTPCGSSGSTATKPFYFAVCIQRKLYPTYEEVCEILGQHGESEHRSESGWENYIPQLPGHTIIILPPVVISNLLPCELHYYVKNSNVEGTLKPGMDATPHAVHVFPINAAQPSLIVGCLPENFKNCRELVVPSMVKNFQMRMSLKDYRNETLVLNVRILWRLNCSVKISIMAGYWIVNRTGLPVVVKQDGCSNVAAGQYETHEVARSLQPLLFSYANRESPYLCTMRLGTQSRLDEVYASGVHLRGVPMFCERFSTDGGSCTRNLKMLTNDQTPNREFYIGISVQRGWGRYLHTHIVTVAPRFMLFNRTRSHRLSFAQRHTISYTADSAGTSFHLTIIPGSSCVFHWPRVDRDTLLCVKLADEPSCHWSGGFFIDKTNAFHVALRLTSGAHLQSVGQLHPLAPHCIFLNIEVTLVKATYCVSVSDADPNLVPPPLRVDNVSSAPIIFKQAGTDESYNTEVPAETQLAYACDEPCLPQMIECNVLGGSDQVKMDMTCVGLEKQLYYENYIYITLGSPPRLLSTMDHLSRGRVVLVLDVQGGQKSHYITLQPLRTGKRSQLWRMTSEGRIYHEGSSPPEKESASHENSRPRQQRSGLVLDIAEMAINQSRQLDQGILLALRQHDERRRSTQTWLFGDDGRLKCRHRNLCVQANTLTVGSPAVLASYDERRVCLPNELCSHHKLIPGSGMLSLKVIRDGPTRVLRIVDIRQKRAKVFAKETDWTLLEYNAESSSKSAAGLGSKFSVSMSMPKGVGISLISNAPEELLYLTMNGVHLNVSGSGTEQIFSLRVQKTQIDNQLLDGYPTVLLSPNQTSNSRASPSHRSSSSSPSSPIDPLISVTAVRQPSKSRMYEIYKSLEVSIGKLSIAIEERLMLKLLHFIGYGLALSQRDTELLTEAKMDLNLSISNINDENYTVAKRFYFDSLNLSVAAPSRLSVITASRLLPELKAIKRALTFPLVSFERAPVSIQAYHKRHLFETVEFVLADLSKHLRDQLMNQAAAILGSVDFLGNPIGLLSDVRSAVVSGLASGNIQNMVKHITHGLSDSTAKFTSTLSAGLGGISMDEEYEDKRRAIQANARSDGGSHVVAGLQGFMAGVIGGLTSVVTQPVKGAQSEGAKGFFTGIGKGLIGTVTKPVTGVLDFASESASAVRQMSMSSDRIVERARPVRCCHSFQGCLQLYSTSQAVGQSFLYMLNKNDYSEHFYALAQVQQDDDMQVLITNKKIYVIEGNEPDLDHVKIAVDYPYLLNAQVLSDCHSSTTSTSSHHTGFDRPMLELTIKSAPQFGQYAYNNAESSQMRYQVKKPKVACRNVTVAQRVCQQINYAKALASQQTETLQCDPDEEDAKDRAFDLEV